jgi:putative salt-induced outer membrane protein
MSQILREDDNEMKKRLLITGLGLMLPMMAYAGADFVVGDDVLAGEVELGATLTTGNTDTSSFKGRLALKHELGNWENQYLLEGLYKEDTDEVTAKRYFLGVQGDYLLDHDNYIFSNINYEVDPFTGYEYSFTAATGYGHKIINNEHTKLKAEIGLGFIYQRLDSTLAAIEGDDADKSIVAHGVINFETTLSETSTFSQKIVMDYGDKLDARSETFITANIVGALAMKFAVIVRYNSNPLQGKTSTDTETNMTLLYAF